jgi:hypothetical protein
MRSVIAAVLASVLLFGGAAWARSSTAKAGPFTVSAKALLWWFKSSPTPVPLVSDGLLDDVDSPAQVLLGGGDRNTNPNPGFRVTAGYDPAGPWGVEASALYNTTQNVAWVGEPLLQPEGPAEPSFKFKSSDFWAHGLNVGLGFRS